MSKKPIEERLFLRNMDVLTVHLAKNAKVKELKNSSRHLKGKKFSMIQHGNDVVVTRYV